MALNYSDRALLPAHTSENNILSPMRAVNGYLAEVTPGKYGECYSRPWLANQGEMEWHFSGKDKVDRCYSPESNALDVVDLLPSDPFGMDIQTTITAITGWLEDLGGNYGGYGWIWNNPLNSQPFSTSVQFNEKLNSSIPSSSSSPHVDETLDAISNVVESADMREMENSFSSYNNELRPAYEEACLMGFSSDNTSCSSELLVGEKVEGASKDGGAPHDAFSFCLMYLGVKDLLSVERVCSSLRSEVRGRGPLLLWKSIHIDQPLNEKITDDILFELASRADGTLQCLSLVECPKITDDGIKRVLETNLQLTKLFVPGCTRLTIEGILNNIRMHNSNKHAVGIKHLRIGGLYGVTSEHYEELKSLLGTNDHKLKSCYKPHFYCRGNYYLPYDDDRAIDIEMCPRCEKFKMVYDCPPHSCHVNDEASQVCRACTLCIIRCAQCGRCIIDDEYEETFYLDLLCRDCF